MHIATNALVLRSVEYKEHDNILTLLTESEGKITASARGCRRKGSTLASGCQLLAWSEMELVSNRDRWTVSSASLQRNFPGVQNSFEKFALACYMAEVIELLAVEGEPAPELLSLILNCLHALDRMSRPLLQVKSAFELRCMVISGYEPLLDSCAICGTEEPENPRFHFLDGNIQCEECEENTGNSLSVSPPVLAAMRHIAWSAPKRLLSFSLGDDALWELARITERYLTTQLERGFHTLDYFHQIHT